MLFSKGFVSMEELNTLPAKENIELVSDIDLQKDDQKLDKFPTKYSKKIVKIRNKEMRK